MIGQDKLLRKIDTMPEIPHFIVLVGDKGSGKQTIAKDIARTLYATYVKCDIKVDSVREVIDNSYKVTDKVLYCFADADNMRAEAKNAMLKITEEPPKNSYFILTVSDSGILLDTIKSRALILNMEPYSRQEILDYCELREYKDKDYIIETALTPYEADMLHKYGHDFIEYVSLVADNISFVESANSFKSGAKLALKNEEDKYDLALFFRAFIKLCCKRAVQEGPLELTKKYCYGIEITTKYLRQASKLGCNKQQVYDMWVLDIRSGWYEYNRFEAADNTK